jgi:DNA-binding NtrC family response regulator
MDQIKVLLIDDDEDVYLLLKRLLKQSTEFEYQITWANNYDDGLSLSLNQPFDVIFQDYYLGPGQFGSNLIAQALKCQCKAPFIMLTSNQEPGMDIKVVKIGAMDYFNKSSLTFEPLEKSIIYAIERNNYRLKIHDEKAKHRSISQDFADVFSSMCEDLLGPIGQLNESINKLILSKPELADEEEIKKIQLIQKELVYMANSLLKVDV